MRKMMVVLALVFTIGSSALSASAFARGGGLGVNHITSRRGGNHSGNVSRAAHRGLFRCTGSGYDPWGHWGSYYGPLMTVP